MTLDEFVTLIDLKSPPAPQDQLEAFEAELGSRLPNDYRQFLARTNGGVIRGWYRFKGRTPRGEMWSTYLHHVCGFREEPHFSLRFNRGCCLSAESGFPHALLWIMDDPGGNGICIGLTGDQRGKVYFWIHDELPDPEAWDGRVESASNVILLAESFTEFVANIGPGDDDDE
jgi:cell wall assembly regulator SMI1